jgi:hypothetical protein
MFNRLASLVLVCFATALSSQFAHAQTAAPDNDANRNGYVGLFAIKEICTERNRAKQPQIEANFAKQTARASPELKAWTTSQEFTGKVAQRKAEQKARMKNADGAALIEGFCENLLQ